jgi:hypothetical protein
MTLHKFTDFYTEWFSAYHNITLKLRTIDIFKNCVKQNNDSNKTCRYSMSMISFYTKLHLSKCNGSWVVCTQHNMNFNSQTAAIFEFFVFDKNGLIKSCSSFEDLSVFKIPWSHVDWCKFCINIRSLNVRHFGMVERTGLKSTASRPPSMAWPLYWIW